jgi:hypothetical protein
MAPTTSAEHFSKTPGDASAMLPVMSGSARWLSSHVTDVGDNQMAEHMSGDPNLLGRGRTT